MKETIIVLAVVIGLMLLLIAALITHNKHQTKKVIRYSRGCCLVDHQLDPMSKEIARMKSALGNADLESAREAIGVLSGRFNAISRIIYNAKFDTESEEK